jgi:hypothetical protein
MAAAIALAESGGDPNSVGHNPGSDDLGLWQINTKFNGATQADFDPLTNARHAVRISNGGADWHSWCTAFSDGACGTKGGTYLGLGAPYQKFLSGGGTPSTSLGGAQLASKTTPAAAQGHSLSILGMFTNPDQMSEGLTRLGEIVLGGLLLATGVVLVAITLAGRSIERASRIGGLVPGPVGAASSGVTRVVRAVA